MAKQDCLIKPFLKDDETVWKFLQELEIISREPCDSDHIFPLDVREPSWFKPLWSDRCDHFLFGGGESECIVRPFTAYGQNKKNPSSQCWNLHFEYSDSYNLLRCLCLSLSLNLIYVPEEFLANNLHTLLHRKMLQRIQIEAAVPSIPKGCALERAKTLSMWLCLFEKSSYHTSCPRFECKSRQVRTWFKVHCWQK